MHARDDSREPAGAQVEEEQEEELLPPPRPGTSAAAAGSSGRAADAKPAPKTFLPLEDDEDDMGIIPDEDQIRYISRHANSSYFHGLPWQQITYRPFSPSIKLTNRLPRHLHCKRKR